MAVSGATNFQAITGQSASGAIAESGCPRSHCRVLLHLVLLQGLSACWLTTRRPAASPTRGDPLAGASGNRPRSKPLTAPLLIWPPPVPASSARSVATLGGKDWAGLSLRANVQKWCERSNGLRAQRLCPNCPTPWPASGILRLPSCSSQVHTTPKSAKGMSCSSISAGKRSISGRRSPPASMCLNTR